MSVPIERFRVTAGPADLACARFGSGTPLVYLHALAYSKEYAIAAAHVLGERFDCIAFDQRGHGDTRGVSREPLPIDLDAMCDDVAAVLDHAGWPSAAVGGTSMGAAVALRFALRHPERLRMLVEDLPAFGPRSPRHGDRAEQIAEALARADLEEAARRATAGLSAGRARALQQALLAQWRHFDASELGPKLASAFRETVAWTVLDDWPDGLSRITVPTHLFALPGDASHPYEVAESMARHIPGAHLHKRAPTLDPVSSFRAWLDLCSRT